MKPPGNAEADARRGPGNHRDLPIKTRHRFPSSHSGGEDGPGSSSEMLPRCCHYHNRPLNRPGFRRDFEFRTGPVLSEDAVGRNIPAETLARPFDASFDASWPRFTRL